MTRIIAGHAGGIRLSVPKRGTRPTSERVRESLFAMLESADAVAGAVVLDLYAGSGALGLEAISRGARSATLVDRAADAARVAATNAARVIRALPDASVTAEVQLADVDRFLRSATDRADLVFLDPPYDLPQVILEANLAAVTPHLSEHALVVVERSARAAAPSFLGSGLDVWREKRYGDTAVSLARLA